MHPEGIGAYLLYTDRSALISKHWNGSTFGDQELIATNVRENSPAAYLITPTTRLIMCISSASTLLVFRYDDEEEEWIQDAAVPRLEVHSTGKFAASMSCDGHFCVFFQDARGRLIHLDESWFSTILLVDILDGSPISTVVINEKTHVVYISAEDHCMHDLSGDVGGKWDDVVMVGCAFDIKIERFIVAENESSGALEAYVLTEARDIIQVIAEGEGTKRDLGKVDESGNFVAGIGTSSSRFICVPLVSIFKSNVKISVKRVYRY